MSTDISWTNDWTVGIRVWVERQGQVVLGQGRLELLEWIDRCHSISAAARQIGMSYRHAWVLVQEVNAAAGQSLVESATGGKHGGGARLTPLGRKAVELFRGLQEELRQSAAGLLPRLLSGPAPARLHVAAAVSLEDVLGQLLTDYALRQPGVQVRLISGASDELAEQILAGAGVDLFLTADPAQVDRLAAQGAVLPDTITTLAENTLAVIGPADSPLTVRKAAGLLKPDVARVALAVPSCPLGSYSRAYLEGQGMYDALLRRAVWADHARAVVAVVQSGGADAGLVYSSATASAYSCRVFFRVRRPPLPIRYVGAVVRRSAHVETACQFLRFLASHAAARRFRRGGFLLLPRQTDLPPLS
jgi:molybdate transport system substrate-binding protein